LYCVVEPERNEAKYARVRHIIEKQTAEVVGDGTIEITLLELAQAGQLSLIYLTLAFKCT
jgi:hypothetical protein